MCKDLNEMVAKKYGLVKVNNNYYFNNVFFSSVKDWNPLLSWDLTKEIIGKYKYKLTKNEHKGCWEARIFCNNGNVLGIGKTRIESLLKAYLNC